MKTLEIPTEFHNYTQKELLTFLRRGRYNVEYRKRRDVKVKAERAEFNKWKEENGK